MSPAVSRTSGRLEKIEYLAALLIRTPPPDVEVVVAFLSGVLPGGRTGAGGAAVRATQDAAPAQTPQLTVAEVERTFAEMAATRGAGSSRARTEALHHLLSRARPEEQDFLIRLLVGELRQGALESVLVEAVARAAHMPTDRVRRAAMMAGALPPVARAVLTRGPSGLDDFSIRVFQPIQPMLADSAPDLSSALGAEGPVLIEFKLDGARIQVHKADDEVRVFSQSLHDVTQAVPEVVDAVRALPVSSLVLDGETLAVRDTGAPHPFQTTMRRFGRCLDVGRLRIELPLSPFFFDCLYLEGSPLIDEPLVRRLVALDACVPSHLSVSRRTVTGAVGVESFASEALELGHEGVMVKALDAPYAAGRRGSAWLKVKTAHTLDLVVLAAEWGSGRRRGWLSNLHLGAWDSERGGLVMLGKTFKGLTDELLRWQTIQLLAREIGRDGHTVYVRPELVVEIAFNDVQESPQYAGRLALRFARVRRYRSDKSAEEADTLQSVREIYRRATGLEPPRAVTRCPLAGVGRSIL